MRKMLFALMSPPPSAYWCFWCGRRSGRCNAAPLQQAQYVERRTRRGVVKCYRDLVVGPYRCHYYRDPL
jgi:hypothetical protein